MVQTAVKQKPDFAFGERFPSSTSLGIGLRGLRHIIIIVIDVGSSSSIILVAKQVWTANSSSRSRVSGAPFNRWNDRLPWRKSHRRCWWNLDFHLRLRWRCWSRYCWCSWYCWRCWRNRSRNSLETRVWWLRSWRDIENVFSRFVCISISHYAGKKGNN